jgi:hypothetical protein
LVRAIPISLVLPLALAASLAVPGFGGTAQAASAASCAIWSTYTEQDGKAANLTATACAATADDSSAVGVQCIGKKPQIRYYPGDGAQPLVSDGKKLTITFAVGDQSLDKTMRYDGSAGAFTAPMSTSDPLLQMLQGGGPLDLSTDLLGPHRFRLLGSTAAIAAVLGGCHIKSYIGPPPPTPTDEPQ